MIFYLFLYFMLAVFLLLLVFYLYYLTFSREAGAVYYPTKPEVVNKMLELANVTGRDTVVDLGSGDGRILIAAAKLGAKAIGYENDPVLVWESRKNIKKAGFSEKAEVRLKSFWHADFNDATVITLYLFPQYMDRLQYILEKNLTHPLLIVSNDYEFPRKKPLKKDGRVFLYEF